MNGSILDDTLRRAIPAALDEFRQRHPAETPYAFVLIGSDSGSGDYWIGYAVATEQGLLRVASEYDQKGYKYQVNSWEVVDNQEKLAIWLRWANPDDGWTYGDFPERFGVAAAFRQAFDAGEFGEDGEGLEESCIEILASLRTRPDQVVPGEASGLGEIIVGFNSGEDPRDFLRTATLSNPYPLVRRHWEEWKRAEEIETRIKRIV
jgi:hypothetical protein